MPRTRTPTQDEINTNSHVLAIVMWPPLPANSMNSMPPSRGRGLGSHMKAAKQGCDSFPERATIALRGSRNDGKGGGGIDKIMSGGGPTTPQFVQAILPG